MLNVVSHLRHQSHLSRIWTCLPAIPRARRESELSKAINCFGWILQSSSTSSYTPLERYELYETCHHCTSSWTGVGINIEFVYYWRHKYRLKVPWLLHTLLLFQIVELFVQTSFCNTSLPLPTIFCAVWILLHAWLNCQRQHFAIAGRGLLCLYICSSCIRQTEFQLTLLSNCTLLIVPFPVAHVGLSGFHFSHLVYIPAIQSSEGFLSCIVSGNRIAGQHDSPHPING